MARGLCSFVGLAAVLVVSFTASANGQQTRALGIDVSAWQTEITTTEWATLKRPTNQQVGGVFGDGRDFVFIRSSRGGTTGYYNQSNADNDPPTNTLSQRYDDPYYIQNITRATNAGLFAGSYHFSRPDIIASTLNSNGIANTGTDEANHFMQMAGPWMRPGYLLPVHDFEAGDGVRPDGEMAEFVLDFSDRIYEVMGVRPAIYVNGNYAQNILGGASASVRQEIVQKHPTLWTARWPNQANPGAIDVQNTEPSDSISYVYGPWDDYGDSQPWSFWQYASTMRLNGNNNKGSNTDVNVANGGIEFVKDKLVPALWWTDASGDWSTMENWNSGQTPVAPVQGPGQVARFGSMTLPTPRLPGHDDAVRNVDGENDTVILDRPSANITVTVSSGTHNIRKLYAREALDITGGHLNIGYAPSGDSTPISAQFSAAVSLSGQGNLSVHTLQVDAARTFAIDSGGLSFNRINLMPGATPGRIVVEGDLNVSPLAGATATIANGSGAGTTGRIDLSAGHRKVSVADGAAEVDLSIGVPIINGGITKAGAGTLALIGANTYQGDTIVEEGRLRLGSATLANGADVYLTTGSLFDLTFSSGTPDVIDSLFIDGVSMQAGVWGADGSGAEFTSPLITGTGRLQVTTFLAPIPGDFNGDGMVDNADLTAWQGGYGMAGPGTENGDADGDGVVDGGDFLTWQQNAGATSAPAAVASAAAVPEPAAAALGLLAIAAGIAQRRLRKSCR